MPILSMLDMVALRCFAGAQVIYAVIIEWTPLGRAFIFALGYLGWFLGPWVLMITTASALIVMLHRQFASESQRALADSLPA